MSVDLSRQWNALQGDSLEILKSLPDNSLDSMVTDPPAGIAYAGKDWDKDKGGRDQWIDWLADIMREAYRVLKPGAHGLVWTLPRTQGWTQIALEDAGFQVLDAVLHVFGQGFPKGAKGDDAVDKHLGKYDERKVIGRREVQSGYFKMEGREQKGYVDITEPATQEALEWLGWASSLKPAYEAWVLVRKPFGGTYGQCLVDNGVGMINIDGTRVPADPEDYREVERWEKESDKPAVFGAHKEKHFEPNPEGRWTPNIILSHSFDCEPNLCSFACPVRMLGDAARFFHVIPLYSPGLVYAPKARKGEREYKLMDADLKTQAVYSAEEQKNFHPTMKPVALMRYLVRMVTPVGAIVLDQFAGSGSTGLACAVEGMRCVLIELDEDYHKITETRVSAVYDQATVGGDPAVAAQRADKIREGVTVAEEQRLSRKRGTREERSIGTGLTGLADLLQQGDDVS